MKSKKVKPHPRDSGSSATPTQDRKSEIANSKSEIVLLAVTGMSPAVLTETVWALAQERPPIIPNRVVVLTTLAAATWAVADVRALYRARWQVELVFKKMKQLLRRACRVFRVSAGASPG